MKNPLTTSPAICLAACLVGVSPALATAPGPEPINLAQVNLDFDQLNHLSVADSFYQQAADLYEAGDYEQALRLSQRALAIRAARLAPDHPAMVSSQRQLAALYRAVGQAEEAARLEEQLAAVPSQPDNGGDDAVDRSGEDNASESSPQLAEAEALNQQVMELHDAGQYAEAIPLAEQALEIFEAQLGPDHPDVAASLSWLALLYGNMGRYGEAEPLFERALAIREAQLGPNHPDVAQSLNNLASLYVEMGSYGEAEPLFERALGIREAQLGPDHPDVAQSLHNLAALYGVMGRYGEAEPLHERALTIREAQLGPDHPHVAISLSSLAALYLDMGRYEEAEPLFERALAIVEAQLGPDHPHVAISLNNLAWLYGKMGHYGDAEPLYEQALAIVEAQLGPDHPHVATSLNNLASLYQAMGRYGEAKPLAERALAIVEAQLGPDHPHIATSLNNLASLYQAMGRYGEAEPLIERALSIREAELGPDHPSVATNLNNLAGLYGVMGRYGEVEPLVERALAIVEAQLGPDHPSVATSLNNLALLYRDMGRYGKAEPLYEQALAIVETQLGPDHPRVATSLNNLASLYWVMGRYREAEPLLERALAIVEAQLSPDHPSVATSLNHLAMLYRVMGRHGEAEPLFSRATDVEEANLARLLAIGSEPQKQAYMATLEFTTHATHTLALQAASPQAPHLGLTTLLRRKGRILDTVTDSLQIVRQELADDPEAQAQLDELIAVRSQLATLSTHGQGGLEPEQFRQRYNDLVQQERALESRLNRLSSAFQAVNEPVTTAAVQAQIPDDAALVEFVRYRPYDFAADRGQRWGDDRYAAYILKPTGEPQVVDLGPAEAIVPLVEDFRLALQNSSEVVTTAVYPSGRALYAQILQPLAEALGEVDHLLLSPDGALNLIPFEALVTDQDRYLIEDYRLSYLTSGRDLVRLDALPNSQNPSLIVANPDYNEADTQVAATPATTRGQQNRRSADLATLSFGALPGTETEVNKLQTLFQETALPLDVLTGRQATETQVKQAQAPSILHIATHGFFLPDQEVELTPAPGLGSLGDTPPPVLNIENPLIRSGLALAAANPPRPDLDANEDDGLLTALELAGMNLYGTQLVVLSACETGVGGNSSGEGIYGLRRALVMAGVQSQVVSLWHVADQRTANLMVDYYQRLLDTENPVGRHEALRDAQLAMLRSEDETSHPYHWAAFIASGDWRPLEF